MREINMRWAIPIYYGGLALITARQSVRLGSEGLWLVHGFGAIVILVAVIHGGVGRSAVRAFRNWPAWLLLAFLGYFAFRAYFDPLVSAQYTRSLFRDVLVPLVFGAVLFGPASPCKRLDVVGLLGGAIFYSAIIGTLLPHMRGDFFLVHSGLLYYQTFGIQCSLLAVAIFVISSSYAGPWANRRIGLWSVVFPIALVATGLIMQAMGSNGGLAYLGVLGITASSAALWKARSDLTNILKVTTGAVFGGAIFITAVALLPPMRFLRFRALRLPDQKGNTSGMDLFPSSIETRADLAAASGIDQILYAPIAGNLAVDRIISGTTGNYLHSVVSLQSHLGLIGSSLLLSFLIGSALNQRSASPQLLALVPATFILSLVAFFTWQPLWFFVGALFMGGAIGEGSVRSARSSPIQSP